MKKIITFIAYTTGFSGVLVLGGLFLMQDIVEAQNALSEVLVTDNEQAQKFFVELEQLQQTEARINANLFSDPAFKSLEDWSASKPLPEEPAGRVNPFAPVN